MKLSSLLLGGVEVVKLAASSILSEIGPCILVVLKLEIN